MNADERRSISVHPRSSAVKFPRSHLVSHRLKLLPLFGRKHRLQASISLTTNLVYLRLRLLAQRSQLFTRVAENLLHFRFLIVVQLQPLCHLFETIAPVSTCDVPVDVERQNPRRESEHEDDQSRNAYLPSVFGDVIHYLPASSSSA